MKEQSKKVLENIRNLEFINQYLEKTKISEKIKNHPRFESILWKISLLMRKAGVKAFSQDANTLLNSILIVQLDGSISIFENKLKTLIPNSIKYYWDSENMKLMKFSYVTSTDGAEITSISSYDDEGIEENLVLEQKCVDGNRYYSNTMRIPNRIDMIKIARLQEIKEKATRLEDIYQIRISSVAFEDIDPDIDEIDPLDIRYLTFLGRPDIYRDLHPNELKIIEESNDEIFPLDDEHKEEQLIDYIETNKFYGRTRSFERAVARYLDIEDRLPTEEHPI